MKILSVNVVNKVIDGELKEILYNFTYFRNGFHDKQRIIEVYKNGDLIRREYYPSYQILFTDNEILIDKIKEIKPSNNLYSFYKLYIDDILKLNLDFNYEVYRKSLIMKTNFKDHSIQVELYNKFPSDYPSVIYIKKNNSYNVITFELRVAPVTTEFNSKNILNGKNRIKFLFDRKVLDFIKNRNQKLFNLESWGLKWILNILLLKIKFMIMF